MSLHTNEMNNSDTSEMNTLGTSEINVFNIGEVNALSLLWVLYRTSSISKGNPIKGMPLKLLPNAGAHPKEFQCINMTQ